MELQDLVCIGDFSSSLANLRDIFGRDKAKLPLLRDTAEDR